MVDGIDIIVPIYNCEKTIQKCIESVINQTNQNYTLILIDDGSTDRSAEICEWYAKSHENIVLFSQRNQGVSAARNQGLKLGKRESIIFLDADDYLPKDTLKEYVENNEEDDEWIVGSYSTFRFSNRASYTELLQNMECSVKDAQTYFITKPNLLSTSWGKLYKRKVIEKRELQFDSSMSIGEDHKFNLMYYSAVKGKIKTISQIVYCYRLGGVASTVKYHENIKEEYYKLASVYVESENLSGVLSGESIFGLFSAAVKHYIVCLPKKEAIREMEKMFCMWKCFELVSQEKWYDDLRSGKPVFAYHCYLRKNFIEVAKRKLLREIRLWRKGQKE